MMFSAELEKAVFLDVKREFQSLDSSVPAAKAIVDYTGAIDKYLITLRKNGGEEGKIIQQEAPEELIERLEPFVMVAEQCLVEGGSGNAETDQLLLDAYFTAQNFLRIAKLYDERFITYAECVRSEVRVKLFCLDPSVLLRQTAKGFRSSFISQLHCHPFAIFGICWVQRKRIIHCRFHRHFSVNNWM